ncbi:hypothetical protein DV515_00000441 [Chloebia gouldiae]|uniref:Uncharacterized protein n=1 Tax=Chloebia gouldiae TaxID=44316 RepID=A0A3L8T060_CHLGU|nr:hypothetical protein DV515_00000441 [Chloebia gouldiae]
MSCGREALALRGELQTQLCQIVWQLPLWVAHSAAPATAKGRGHEQSALLQAGSPQHRQASQNQVFQKCETLASLNEADSRNKLITISCGQEHPIPMLSPTVSKASRLFRITQRRQ